MSTTPRDNLTANGAHGWTLLRCRSRQLLNALDQQLRDAPIQTLAVVIMLALIWVALYALLLAVLQQVRSWPLIGVVAQQHVFMHFFFILGLMLAFSNAVLAFSSLYGREEAGHLLAMPTEPRQVILVKWLEGLALSSWSFLLLGFPMMLAVAYQQQVDWTFYVLFTGHFVGFAVIPATAGILAAWLVAMFAPRRPLTIALWLGALAIVVILVWFWRISQAAPDADQWLRRMIDDLGFTRSPLLPSAWTARGVIALLRHDVADSLIYLSVVAGNGIFLVWLTVNLIGGTWAEAFNRAQHSRVQPVIKDGWITESMCVMMFWYLPRRLRMLMLKDIRTFTRDATQWTQMVIMLGLLVVYALNLDRLPINVHNSTMQTVVAFLNLTTVSLILATFTSRFVYPLLSLESQQLWLLGLLPLERLTLLLVKFLFALTVTGLSGLVVMGIAVHMLELPVLWSRVNLAVCMSICVGLCGLSVGLGARYPVLGQRNPARIASGLGGSFNLIASMIFVGVEMFGMLMLSIRELRSAVNVPNTLTPEGWQMVIALTCLGPIVAASALVIGARHFTRLEY